MTRRTILVVEDNPLTRKMLRLTLESEGYEVVEAGDREGALEGCAARRLDLVVLDYVLPDTDGLLLLEEVRRRAAPAELPALMVTGMVSRLDEIRARAGPSTQVVAKPVDPAQLLSFVQAHLAGPRQAAHRGCSILVVDDEPLNRKLTALRLTHAGYTVDTATGGAEALEKALAQPPDAILADVLMPSMDGFAFCREARRHPRLADIPIVLISSAYVEEADQELARQVGANALVLRTPELADAIDALGRSQQGARPSSATENPAGLADLHRERLQVQLERQTARNDVLVRQAAIQATALSVIRGLSEALAQPEDASKIIGDVLVHCLDATGLSTGLLYLVAPGGRYEVDAQFGIGPEKRAEAERCFGHAGLIQRIVESGEPAAFSSETALNDPEAQAFLSNLGHTSVLVVPFVVLGQSFGVLLLASDTHDLAEPAWLGFARSLAGQFGQTVALGQSLTRLATSEERRRALMEEANDAILILDAAQQVLEANREADRLLGRPRGEIVGQDYLRFIAPDEGENHERNRAALREWGRVPVERSHLLRVDGTRVPVEVSSSLIRVRGGSEEPVTLSLLRDISDRVEAETALREAQARLEHVVSSSPAVLFLLKVEGEAFEVAWVSPNVERLLGFAVREVKAQWWEAQIHPEDRARVLAEFATIFTEGHVEQEYRFRTKAGSYCWLRAELRLLRDAAGRPVEAAGSWTDVSARKEAELRLRESEEQYRLLFDSNPHPMWVFDAQTLAFLAVNDAAVRHYGYSREEFLSMTSRDIRPPEEVPAFLRSLKEIEADHDPTRVLGLFKHRKKDGTDIQMDIATSRIRFLGREAWLVLAMDVTEKRSLEAQLVQAQKMESIGRLAGGVAHDFNNILGVITGYGELLRRRLPDDARLRKYAEDVLTAAHRAAGLTRQLLAFSRRQVLQPRVLDLNRIVEETERMLRRVIGEDVRLVTALGENLPSIRADAGQLEQVVMNLVVNARDAMPRGGRLVIETSRVEFDHAYAPGPTGVGPGQYVVLAISDTGQGMSPEVQAQIFEPFFTTKEAGKGTGLGLATVHGIVKQSGGHITVDSEPERGTTFKIYLPTVEDAPPVGASPLAEEEPPRGTETLLVVEDEEVLREILDQALAACGYQVLSAPHGLAALEIAEKHPGPIHLLLTDVVLPGLGGRETARQLAVQRPETKVLYMSGYTDDAVVLHGVQTAEMAFLEKPFTALTLARKVREVLEGK